MLVDRAISHQAQCDILYVVLSAVIILCHMSLLFVRYKFLHIINMDT